MAELLHQPFRASEAAQDDARLLALCRTGDELAWRALLTRYEKLICAVPRRAGLQEENVAEVFQEVVVSLLEGLHLIEQPERLRAWLVTTAKYKTWHALERQSVAARKIVPDALEDSLRNTPDGAPGIDAAMQQIEEQHLIRIAFAALEERCRKLLAMLFYEDEPRQYREIALELGVAQTSISPLRARCLKRLQRLLVR